MHARLPEALEQRDTIERMQIGEERWTVPWAMWVDLDRRCWLHPKDTTNRAPFGTSDLRIVRVAEGYLVDTSCTEFRWGRAASPGYVGGSGGSDWLPVVEMVTS